MSLHPALALFLTPDKATLAFATRGVIAMALALFVAMSMQLERPYWALISAIFLQIRPETGLVIEKGVCQIVGTLVGGAVGVAILAAFLPYPAVAMAALALWVGGNAAASALLRRLNLVYGLAIAAITAVLVVALSMVSPPQLGSQAVFQVATARVSEIVVGAVCATLVAMLLWRVRVKEMLMRQARTAINRSLEYMELELAPDSLQERRHESVDSLLQSVIALNDDSGAALFEGPEGPGRARAATLLGQKLLSLIAVIQVFGRFRRRHPELIGAELEALLETLRERFRQMRLTGSEQEARRMAQALRRELQQHPHRPEAATPIQRRLMQMAREMVGDLIVVLQANRAVDNSDQALLKAPRLVPYRDPLLGAITGLRSMLIFLIGAGVWLATGSPTAVVFMVLPVIYSIMLARLPSPPLAMRQLLVGAIAAVPVALFFSLELLARAPQSFVLLIMVFGTPLFFGLMALTNVDTRPYGLGFAITYILLIRPSNQMVFAAERFFSTALAIVVAIGIVYAVFRLITAPGARIMQRRLVASTIRDLRRLGEPRRSDAEDWFNARMAERLMRLSAYDRALPEAERHLTDLGLTGLNLGHTALRLQRQLEEDGDARVRVRARQWQRALADAYYHASRGRHTEQFRRSSSRLLDALRASERTDAIRRQRIEGTMERVALTFERIATAVASATRSDSGEPPQEASPGPPSDAGAAPRRSG